MPPTSEDSSGVSRCAGETPALSESQLLMPFLSCASSRCQVYRHRLRKGSKRVLIKSRAVSLPPQWNGLLDEGRNLPVWENILAHEGGTYLYVPPS